MNRVNSSVGKTNRQRSWPLQITRPPSSSGRNLAGRARRPLSSRRGVCVPRNTGIHLRPTSRRATHPPAFPTEPHRTPLQCHGQPATHPIEPFVRWITSYQRELPDSDRGRRYSSGLDVNDRHATARTAGGSQRLRRRRRRYNMHDNSGHPEKALPNGARDTGAGGHHSAPPETEPHADVQSVRIAAERIAANIDQVIEGKHDTVRLGVAVLLAEGHLLIEDVPGVGKTKFAKALARSIDCSVRRVQFTPDLLPERRHRRERLQLRGPRLRVQARPGVRQHRRRRRDQPRLAQDAVRPARVHGGAAGHRRRRHLPARVAVPGAGHAEPDRHGGHLPAARGPARPVHRADLDGLPRPARRDRDARRARRARPARVAAAGLGRRARCAR